MTRALKRHSSRGHRHAKSAIPADSTVLTDVLYALARATQSKPTAYEMIRELRARAAVLVEKLAAEGTRDGASDEAALLRDTWLRFLLLERVCPAAQLVLVRNDAVDSPLAEFFSKEQHDAFVMSIDIRQSTELMGRASSPQKFGSFIAEVCDKWMRIVKSSYGVIDKFTGDGLLAFFPEFFSGVDAAFYVAHAATQCHNAFVTCYSKHEQAFERLLETGLGIGIDHGGVLQYQVAGGLTVIGDPVVQACRLAGAPAGQTLVNIRAMKRIQELCPANFKFEQVTLELKHQKIERAFSLNGPAGNYQPRPPSWIE